MAELTVSPPQTRVGRFELLDYLRFVAAAMVVLMHYLVNGIAGGKVTSLSANDWAIPWAKYGYMGVSLFFLISGFVITKSSHGKTARQFAVGRAVRLYPSFWVALLFTSVVAMFFANDQMSVTVPQILVNATMIPGDLRVAPVDGVYWTLAYELKFYFLVFLFLFFGKGRWLDRFIPAWTVVMVAISVVSFHHSTTIPYAGGYYLLFAAGALIAHIRDHGPRWWTVVPLLGAYVMSVRFAMDEADQFLAHKGTALNADVVGVIMTVFFMAVASMCIPWVAALQLPHARSIGALTFPIYLLHAHFGYMMLNHFATDQNKWLVYPVLIAVLLSLAWLLHWAVETGPRMAWWKQLFDRTIGRFVGAVQPAGAEAA
ncbi:acyltransferase [Nocardioides sp. KR10-350]|uniref:acyltransferase family protein n=1 Tax=Nocardioides cheoyonin TaxID=3156615 RepID=UPI0032B49CDE